MPKRTAAKPRSSGRALRMLRRGRPIFILVWAALVSTICYAAYMRHYRPDDPLLNRPLVRDVLGELARLERQSVDLRFRWRGPEPANSNIVIVVIDQPILSEMAVSKEALAKSPALQAMTEGYQESWRHVVWAEAIERLTQHGAKVIVFDVIFLRKSMEAARVERLLKRLKEQPDAPATPDDRLVELAGSDAKHFRDLVDKSADKLVFGMSLTPTEHGAALILPHPSLVPEDFDNLLGNVLIPFDDPTDQIQRNALHRWLEPQILLDVKGLDALAVQKFNGTLADNDKPHPIRFQGPGGTYPFVPLETLLIDEELEKAPFNGGQIFKDKIVYIGATYELAHDNKNTPFGVMPGVEVHANVAGDLLTGLRLHDASLSVARWITFLSVLLPVAIVLFVRQVLLQALAALGLLAGYTFLCHVAFSRWDLILPMAYPLLAPAFISVGTVYTFFLEQREKAHIRKVFNRFVSKRIAGVVLKNSEEFETARQGEKRPVAVLFSDIRNFTAWSEAAEPDDLVGQLNEYFERMVGHIEDTEGNVQKFIGDAILAAWGDTHSNGFPDDCRRAVATALTMRPALRELNARWAAREDRREISIGLGINHGEVVVGEVGHPERREYTVLGDGVNFAARLESATKQFHTDILVGETVEKMTREHFVFRHVDFVRVKGKTLPLNIYIPLSEKTVAPPEWLADYHRARSLYVERNFAEAADLFRATKARIGGEDYLCDLYLERCALYAQEPPPAEWDGSYTMTEK